MRRRTRPPGAGAHKGCADNVSRPEGPVPKGCAGIARWRRYSACRYPDIDCTSRLATDRFRLQRDPRRLCRGSLRTRRIHHPLRKPRSRKLPALSRPSAVRRISGSIACSARPITAHAEVRLRTPEPHVEECGHAVLRANRVQVVSEFGQALSAMPEGKRRWETECDGVAPRTGTARLCRGSLAHSSLSVRSSQSRKRRIFGSLARPSR